MFSPWHLPKKGSKVEDYVKDLIQKTGELLAVKSKPWASWTKGLTQYKAVLYVHPYLLGSLFEAT